MRELKQGADQTLTAHDVVDRDKNPIDDWTGWTAHGMARAGHPRGAKIGEWHSAPSGSQEQVTFTAGTGSGGTVSITVTGEMSAGWSAAHVVIHVEIYSPTGRPARIIAEECTVSPEAVYTD